MNYITIKKLEDLDQLLEADIYLTGNSENMQEELEYNTWGIVFDFKLIQKLSILDLKNFIFALIKERAKQVRELGLDTGATFYMWFDEQALQLCFDVLSNRDITLPFGCKLNILKSCEIILKKFLHEAQKAAKRGGHLLFEDMKILEPGDEGWDDEDNEIEWIQDVYVTTIP